LKYLSLTESAYRNEKSWRRLWKLRCQTKVSCVISKNLFRKNWFVATNLFSQLLGLGKVRRFQRWWSSVAVVG
jgi:hypothetical protein